MNKPNNKRKKSSQERIEKAFVQLIQNKNLNEIYVTDICKNAKVNRSTFYANYLDIYDLADKIKESLSQSIIELYTKENFDYKKSISFEKLLNHVKDNQLFYKTYFKLASENDAINFGYDKDFLKLFYKDDEFLDYHITFFASGLNAIIKKWLSNGCKESVETLQKILEDEYKK